MALSKTDRERMTLVVAALEAEAKEAAERASCSSTPFPDFHWQNQCSQAADTLRELIARCERKA